MNQKIRLARIIVLVGFLILAAPLVLTPVLAQSNSLGGGIANAAAGTSDCPTGYSCTSGIAIPETELPDTPIEALLLNFMSWLFGIFGFLAIITFLIAGIQYFMAAGNPDSAKKAKQNIIYSIIGIMVALSGFIIILAISNFLSGYDSF